MSDYGKTKVVDGFTALKAIQQGGRHGTKSESADRKDKISKPTPIQREPRAPGSGIGRTVMPTKYEIICYECGFEYKVTGRADYTYCPKCRSRLDRTDHVITGTLTNDLVTAGKVHLTATASLESATLTARELILDGTAKSGLIVVNGVLEIGPESSYMERLIEARDLRIPPASRITLRSNAQYRNVEVHGVLKARLQATGVITVKSGALLKGDIRGTRLVVEEGGGVVADLAIEPDRVREEETTANAEERKTA